MTLGIEKSTVALDKWLHVHKHQGYDPFDGLTSYLRPLTLGNCFAERILEQLVLRCPFNIRPLLGIKKQGTSSATSMGLLARGYLRMWLLKKNAEYRDEAVSCLDWLVEGKSSGYSGYCWGLNYDHASRGGQLPRHVPLMPTTCLIGQAFLDAYEILHKKEYLEIAVSICTFIEKVFC